MATAMVGYGLVRSSLTTSPAGRGSIAAGAGAVAVLDRPAPRALPPTSKARTERLDELAEEIEKLKVGACVRARRIRVYATLGSGWPCIGCGRTGLLSACQWVGPAHVRRLHGKLWRTRGPFSLSAANTATGIPPA